MNDDDEQEGGTDPGPCTRFTSMGTLPRSHNIILWCPASPYLLSLGLSKSMMSIVFLAGPLSGLIVQPVVGVFSDSCKSQWGRRRPFIVAGCAASSVSVIVLGWSKDIAAVFAARGGLFHTRMTIALAVISVYLLDFSINVVMAVDRSLLVDVIPPHLQATAQAWAGRLFGVGAVVGYLLGGVDMVYWTRGWLGSEQLKALTLLTALSLCACHVITCVSVSEKVLLEREDEGERTQGGPVIKAARDIWHTWRTLPKPIHQVFNVQFSNWIGWFPILFFSSTYVAEFYARSASASSSTDLSNASADIREAATRVGSQALLFQSLVSLATSVVLPLLVAPMNDDPSSSSSQQQQHVSATAWRAPRRPRTRTAESGFLALETAFTTYWDRLVARHLPQTPFDWLTMPLLWTASNALFALLLFATYWVKDVAGASAVIALTGVCWSITNWAPFSILGELILRLPQPLSSSGGGGRSEGGGALGPHGNGGWQATALSPILEDEEGLGASGGPSGGAGGRLSGESQGMKTPTLRDFSPREYQAREQRERERERERNRERDQGHGEGLLAGIELQAFKNKSVGYSPHPRASSKAATATAGARKWYPGQHHKDDDASSISESENSFYDADSVAGSTFSSPRNPIGGHHARGGHGRDDSRGRSGLGSAGGGGHNNNANIYGVDPYSYNPDTPDRDRYGSDSTPRIIQVRHSDSIDLDSEDDDGSIRHNRAGNAAAFEAAAAAASRSSVGLGFDGEDVPSIRLHESDGSSTAGPVGDAAAWGDFGTSSEEDDAADTADQAGVILGCHNVYLVIPQLLVTALSSIIFAFFAPGHSVVAGHGAPASSGGSDSDVLLYVRQDDEVVQAGTEWDTLGMIFRFGGVSVAISAWLCWRMARDRGRERDRDRIRRALR